MTGIRWSVMINPIACEVSGLLEEFECLLALWCYADVPAAPFQDSPAGGRLNVVVIHQ